MASINMSIRTDSELKAQAEQVLSRSEEHTSELQSPS